MKLNGHPAHGEPSMATATMSRRAPLRAKAGEYLSALQIAMQATGLLTRYEPFHVGPPRLVVTNPAAARPQEVIYAAPRNLDMPNEEWCFWWAWGDPICPVENVDEAARRIAIMLRP